MATHEKAPQRANASRPGNVPTDATLSYQTSPTLQEAEEALSCIPANCPEAEWSKMGMALSAEFPGPDGFAVFDQWSQGSPDQYNRADLKSRWQSWSRGHGVTIKTLFGIAREHGYRPQRRAPLTAAELAELDRARAEREAERRQAEAQRQTEADHAAARARELWRNAPPAPADHPYFIRKGIKSHDLRLFCGNLVIAGLPIDGALIVPAVNIDGALRGLQFVAADPPGANGKRNLPQASIKGCFWRLGEFSESGSVILTEGPATAASVKEASEADCVVCTFSAGNLEAVARAIRARYPAARLIFVPDNDETGLAAAARAARAVGGSSAPPRARRP